LELQDTCTGMSGNISMGRSLTDMLSITMMETNQTTTYPISLYFPDSENILEITGPNGLMIRLLWRKLENIWYELLFQQQQNGIKAGRPKSKESIRKLEKKHGSEEKRKAIIAPYVEKNTNATVLQGNEDFVRQLVNLRLEDDLGLITKSENARFAEKNLSQINIQKKEHAAENAAENCAQGLNVVSKKYLEPEYNVYDLTVDGAHCFFANGILVSNCQDALQYCFVKLNQSLSYANNIFIPKRTLTKAYRVRRPSF